MSIASGDSEFQVGGITMIPFGNISFRIPAQGEDSRNLGQWSHITLTGKNNVTTIIFTCYCPYRSSSIGSAYIQHMLYMVIWKENIPAFICPR